MKKLSESQRSRCVRKFKIGNNILDLSSNVAIFLPVSVFTVYLIANLLDPDGPNIDLFGAFLIIGEAAAGLGLAIGRGMCRRSVEKMDTKTMELMLTHTQNRR